MVGLDEALGGADAASAAYAAVAKAINTMAQQDVANPPTFGRTGVVVGADDAEIQAGLFGGAWALSHLGPSSAVTQSNRADEFPVDSEPSVSNFHDGDTQGTSTSTMKGDLASVTRETDLTATNGGLSGTSKVVSTVAPCPDASGKFTAQGSMSVNFSAAQGQGAVGISVEVLVEGTVDDDARLASSSTELNTQANRGEGGADRFSDTTVTVTTAGGGESAYAGTINDASDNADATFIRDNSRLGFILGSSIREALLSAAQQGWESGRCVSLNVTTTPGTTRKLKPSTPVEIVAAPVSKIDGAKVGGTVTATLNGGTSVSPAGTKVPADATFAYVAPNEKDADATVSLEARSKRGVAKHEVLVDTRDARGFYADPEKGANTAAGATNGGWGDMHGNICDVTVPFTLTGTGISMEFTPAGSGDHGRVTYTMKFGPLSQKAKGTYRLRIDGDTGVLRAELNGTFKAPGVSMRAGGFQEFALGPITDGGCAP